MKKKIALILIVILFIGIGMILVTTQPSKQVIETKENKQSRVHEEEQQTDRDVEKEQENIEAEQENDPIKTQFKDMVSEAVQSTIDYFTNKETHITAIGDSLTQGVGDSTGDGGYVGILDKALNKDNQIVKFENYGKRGNRSDQLLKRLEKPEIATSISNSDIVLITIGANDIMKVVKENFTNLTFKDFAQERIAYEERLKKIFDKINKFNPNMKIYLLGFYNPFGKYFPEIKELGIIVENWNSTGKKVAGMYENITFIPTIDLFDDTNVDLFAEDNFHPNTRGYQRMARRVLEYLTN
ncbi:SGNH/GDSL hydrolase family protein [Virgibacillus ndiopensis]|uniref:SGNH/GDSL hydrolase family protein n=1 Tax=Virgibacillus ndiopensis TaxID=2004408 RepID=UPI000C08740B|nr:SGNH/GDSL hydrolase family protein [Virgibacillus ndiopensis]